MKLLTGNFGGTKEDKGTLGESIDACLAHAGIDKESNEATFLLIVDIDGNLSLMSNELRPGDGLLMLEIGKQAVLGTAMGYIEPEGVN